MFDLSPLYRSTIGFDRLARLLSDMAGSDAPNWPPYNIERLGENEYRLTMAVAGFGPEDLHIEVKDNVLVVSGRRPEKFTEGELLHQGIAARSFERRFQLADFVEVDRAELSNGLLHIWLKRELPEEMKPKTIPIRVPAAAGKRAPKTIEATAEKTEDVTKPAAKASQKKSKAA
jgi:molecular chaperone IbpA